MTLEDVTALARAGFTAQQISAFMQLDKAPADPAPAPVPAADPAPAPAPAADPAPAPAPAPAEKPKTFDDIYAAIANMQRQIQAGNLLAAQQAQPAQPDADQIIANIINPPTLTKGDK